VVVEVLVARAHPVAMAVTADRAVAVVVSFRIPVVTGRPVKGLPVAERSAVPTKQPLIEPQGAVVAAQGESVETRQGTPSVVMAEREF
jgi:hypothetical protein